MILFAPREGHCERGRAARLEEIDADVVDREACALLVILQCDRADGLGAVLHYQVQVRLVLLAPRLLEVVEQPDHALVVHALHHLQLAVVVAPV